MARVHKLSKITGKLNSMDIPGVTQYDVDMFVTDSRTVQEVFPNLSPDEREFIKSGITPEEWDSELPEDDAE